jgi:hypothetical protein
MVFEGDYGKSALSVKGWVRSPLRAAPQNNCYGNSSGRYSKCIVS